MPPIIAVESLSKRYVLRHERAAQYATLRDLIAGGFVNAGRRALHPFSSRAGSQDREEFWALKDVGFEVKRGERLGIIGKNGAGKSTLLKVLSRITEPTRGRIRLGGRVASLLEVGTGFHPELTGRENIFLNGAILGMNRAEIRAKFDEIVAFAEVEKFLDTPVKRYSSGMYARLAFAVAAHLEPEILIVDEVLAVGDAQFQRKCLGSMEKAGREGRTVLFVSHNMGTITSLCDRCLLLDSGRIVCDGATSSTVLRYYSGGASSPASYDASGHGKTVGDEHVRLLSGSVEDPSGRIVHEFELGQPFRVCMRYRLLKPSKAIPAPNFHFFTADGTYAFVSVAPNLKASEPGDYLAECHVPGHLLNEGTFFVGLAVTSHLASGYAVNFFERSALSFNVRDSLEDLSARYSYAGPMPGLLRPRLDWDIRRLG